MWTTLYMNMNTLFSSNEHTYLEKKHKGRLENQNKTLNN